jgi:hypothetical protein
MPRTLDRAEREVEASRLRGGREDAQVAEHDRLAKIANGGVGERLHEDLRADAGGVPHGDADPW